MAFVSSFAVGSVFIFFFYRIRPTMTNLYEHVKMVKTKPIHNEISESNLSINYGLWERETEQRVHASFDPHLKFISPMLFIAQILFTSFWTHVAIYLCCCCFIFQQSGGRCTCHSALSCSPFDSIRFDRLLCRFNLILFVWEVSMLLPLFNSKIKTRYRLKLDFLFVFSHSMRQCNWNYRKSPVFWLGLSNFVVAIGFAVNFSQCSIPIWTREKWKKQKCEKQAFWVP